MCECVRACVRASAGLGAVLTISWLGQMDDHCTNNIKWDQLTADERTLPYYKDHEWCDDVSGLTAVTFLSLIVTLSGAVAGVLAACFSNELYLNEELDDSG